MANVRQFTICLVLAMAAVLLPLTFAQAFPAGVYYVLPAGTSQIPTAVQNAKGIVGVLARDTWQDIESTEGQYNWSNLDSAIANAQTYNLAVEIAIQDGPPMAPPWVVWTGSQTIQLYDTKTGTCVTAPVYWDTKYHAAVLDLYEHLVAHLSGKGIAGVMVSPFDWDNNDWEFPESPGTNSCGTGESDQQRWLDVSVCNSASHTPACFRSLMLPVAEDKLSAVVAAGLDPNSIIKLPIHVGNPNLEGVGGSDGTELLQSVLQYISGQTFVDPVYTQGNFIAADTPTPADGVVPTTLAAAEATSDNTLQDLYFLYYWATDQGYLNMNVRGLQSTNYGACNKHLVCSTCTIAGSTGLTCSGDVDGGQSDPEGPLVTQVSDVALSYSPTFFELVGWPNFAINDNEPALSYATTQMGGTVRN